MVFIFHFEHDHHTFPLAATASAVAILLEYTLLLQHWRSILKILKVIIQSQCKVKDTFYRKIQIVECKVCGSSHKRLAWSINNNKRNGFLIHVTKSFDNVHDRGRTYLIVHRHNSE